MRPSLAVVPAVLLFAACESPVREPVFCTAIAVDALVVTILDAATGQRVCDATVTATDGAFSEALRPFPAGPTECTYSGPTERAGTYTVRVTRDGYQPAQRTGVFVDADECHVIPVRLSIELSRAP